MGESCDVAIIGYGPVGATLANMLGRSGLDVVALEREGSVHRNPRAASLDAEAMRVFQSIGLADAIAGGASTASGMRFVNAEGKLLMHWRRLGASPEGWATAYRFHQPTMEGILRDAASRLPNVRTALRAEVTAVEPGARGVEVAYTMLDTGERRTLSAAWVVGCDGARSRVREAIGGALRELGGRERWMVLDILLKDAAGFTETVGDSVQHCDPARPATYIPLVGRRRRWEFMLLPGEGDSVAPERVWSLLRPWEIGPDNAEIERAVVYTFSAVVAERWRAGRLLIAGDAAHQMPPFLGQGLCAGLRDAANLAWKLAGVARGRYGPDILDSYQSERAPHVEAVIKIAVRIGGIIQATDLAKAAARDQAMIEKPETLSVAMPPLGPGLHGSDPPPAGQRSAQPRLGDGVRLDERVGDRFAVVATPGLLAGAYAGTLAIWRRAGACVVPASGEAAEWLAELGRAAVIIRPDRAILATASTSGELDDASRLIPHLEGATCTSNRLATSA